MSNNLLLTQLNKKFAGSFHPQFIVNQVSTPFVFLLFCHDVVLNEYGLWPQLLYLVVELQQQQRHLVVAGTYFPRVTDKSCQENTNIFRLKFTGFDKIT